jgi:Flp pilus assembly protein TadD
LELIDHYTQGGYPELALEHCRLAATRFPESAAVQLSMAKLLRQMKMTREAVQGLGAFLGAHPQKSPDYESWLGIMRDELGDWVEGEKAHRAALALNANLDSLHNNLGYNLLMQGRPKEAAQEFREALKLRPNSEVARNNLGMAMAATPQDAVLHWQSVSDPATAHSNMAALLIKQKRYAEARRELDLALGYNKNHAAALNNLRLVSELDGKPAVIPLKPAQTKWGKFRSKVAKIVGG